MLCICCCCSGRTILFSFAMKRGHHPSIPGVGLFQWWGGSFFFFTFLPIPWLPFNICKIWQGRCVATCPLRPWSNEAHIMRPLSSPTPAAASPKEFKLDGQLLAWSEDTTWGKECFICWCLGFESAELIPGGGGEGGGDFQPRKGPSRVDYFAFWY